MYCERSESVESSVGVQENKTLVMGLHKIRCDDKIYTGFMIGFPGVDPLNQFQIRLCCLHIQYTIIIMMIFRKLIDSGQGCGGSRAYLGNAGYEARTHPRWAQQKAHTFTCFFTPRSNLTQPIHLHACLPHTDRKVSSGLTQDLSK